MAFAALKRRSSTVVHALTVKSKSKVADGYVLHLPRRFQSVRRGKIIVRLDETKFPTIGFTGWSVLAEPKAPGK